MATDKAQLADDLQITVNGDPVGTVPSRPPLNGTKHVWGGYVVALGLHPDQVDNHSKAELIELAERLGG
jgi:hypothetical protein